MRRPGIEKNRHGDTLVEVMFSISIFAFVAMITINMMNDGINTAQRTLEAQMARNEIDAQAEALRFVHNSYVADRQKTNSASQFHTIWKSIVSKAKQPSVVGQDGFDINNLNECADVYEEHINNFGAFALNARLILPKLSLAGFSYLGKDYDKYIKDRIVLNKDDGAFGPTPLYPRIIYKTLNTNAGEKTYDVEGDTALDEGATLYNDIDKVQDIFEKLDDKNKILDNKEEDNNDINIYIGHENNLDDDVTVIKTNYKTSKDNGTIAIIGPKRMEYYRVVNLLDYIKKQIERDGNE